MLSRYEYVGLVAAEESEGEIRVAANVKYVSAFGLRLLLSR